MTLGWLEITSAASFGAFVTGWQMRALGVSAHKTAPSLALLTQALVLWIAGTSAAGTFGSFAAGTAVLFASMWLARRWSAYRDGEDR